MIAYHNLTIKNRWDYSVNKADKMIFILKMLQNMGDISVCDEMKDEDAMQKNYCYTEVDPDYRKTQENCDLYNKFVSIPEYNYAENDQAKCVLNNLVTTQYTQKQLNCTKLTARFKKSDYYNLIDSGCRSFETLQAVVLTGKPINCDGYNDLNDQEARAVCYSEFVGTPEHAQFCRYVSFETENHGKAYYYVEQAAELAKCSGAVPYYTGYTPTLVNVFANVTTIPVYVPGEYVFESWGE